MRDLDLLLSDLLLEASDKSETKLLLLVAPRDKQAALRRRFGELCEAEEISVAEIAAPEIPRNKLLSLLLENITKGRADVLSIVDISYESLERRVVLYDALNFQRDAILRLSKPVLLWLTVEETFEIAKNAPDFWSRRTAVYHFDDTSAQSLIAKLFRNSPIPRETFVSDASLSECLEIILRKEAQLQQHVSPKSELDISRAKECQQRLIAAADQLLAAINEGKALELTLWLWNLSNLDSTLQEWISRLDRRDRDLLESMYTDRNEVILSLAGDLAKIVKRYKAGISRHLGKLRPASLLDLFRDRADNYLDETARQLASLSIDDSSIRVTDIDEYADDGHFTLRRGDGLSDDNEEWDDLDQAYIYDVAGLPHATKYGDDLDPAYLYDAGTINSEVAAQELESWLAGRAWKRPRYLTADEGKLLKDLYLGKSILALAKQFGASDRQIMSKVDDLQKKLRLRLGVSARRATKVETPPPTSGAAEQAGSSAKPRKARNRA
jgi:hypothetical protein